MKSPRDPDCVQVRSSAKINLALRVGPCMDDGYHRLGTLFQAVSIHDDVLVCPAPQGEFSVSVKGEQADLVPTDGRNLVVKAARLLADEFCPAQGAHITIKKMIPVTGGMAGGSADCAAALLACSVLWDIDVSFDELTQRGARLGADVPFALLGQTAYGSGRGDELVPVLTRGTYHWVLVFADYELSTPDVFRRFDEMNPHPDEDLSLPPGMLEALASKNPVALAGTLINDLQAAAFSLRPELEATLAAGMSAGALAGLLSGSGPTMAFLAASEEAAIDLSHALRSAGVGRAVKRVHGPVAGARLVN